MGTFDQFANQGGQAAGDPEEAAAAQVKADDLLKKTASAANAADFGGGPLGSNADAEPQESED
ncbi:MAG TPA: hypothetical protein VGC18_10145 [Lacisediminihabitans sp.]|uniref:hypothetical protein n=1 Tax=Lacisediminihabitans sp. TaxID=2787631 RepID=UPI002ED91973